MLTETDFMTKCFVAYFTRERSEIIFLHCMIIIVGQVDGLWNMYYIVDNMYLLRNIYYNVKVDISHLLPL